MSLPFFPTPYPDETLHSIVARYHYWSANPSPRDTIWELFATVGQTPVSAMPNCLDRLTERLSSVGGNVITSDRLIFANTLFPLIKPFVNKQRGEGIIRWMKNSTGLPPFGNISLSQSHREEYRTLRYCEKCIKEDTKKYGEAYWHRSHQVRGIYICHKHDTWLEVCFDHKVRFGLHTAEAAAKLKHAVTFKDEEYRNRYVDIARGVNWLLNNEVPSLCKELMKHRYWQRANRNLNMPDQRSAFVSDFCKFYSDQLLLRTGCAINTEKDESWPCSLIIAFRQVPDPIKHILLQQFLGFYNGDFWDANNETNEPFGRGPWECLNIFSEHYRQKVVEDCEIKMNPENQGWIGRFSCKCDYVYEKNTAPYKDDEDSQDTYVMRFGRVWQGRAFELFREKNISTYKIAHYAHVDTMTVIENLKSSRTTNEEKRRLSDEEQQIRYHRQLFLEFKEREVPYMLLIELDWPNYSYYCDRFVLGWPK